MISIVVILIERNPSLSYSVFLFVIISLVLLRVRLLMCTIYTCTLLRFLLRASAALLFIPLLFGFRSRT
jgi:hypothetical protein